MIATRSLVAALLSVLALVAALPAQAQQYPTRTIKGVVPCRPAGIAGSVTRFVAQTLSGSLGQTVLRSGQQLHARVARRDRAADPDREQQFSRARHAGTDRLCQGESDGYIQLR